MAPARTLGLEDEAFVIGSWAEKEVAEVDECGGFLVNPFGDLGRCGIDFENLFLLESADVEFEQERGGGFVVPESDAGRGCPGVSAADNGFVSGFDGLSGGEVVDVSFAGVQFVARLVVESGVGCGTGSVWGC